MGLQSVNNSDSSGDSRLRGDNVFTCGVDVIACANDVNACGMIFGQARISLLPGPRVGFVVNTGEVLEVEVGVNLGGRDIGMAE